MSLSGYYRYPAISGETIAFVSEDDLWIVPASGGVARRLTAGLAAVMHPRFSPDGATLALTGREEGNSEVYVMPAEGGPMRRITYLGVTSLVAGWTPDGNEILFTSDSGQPFDRVLAVHSVPVEGGPPRAWDLGPAMSVAVAPGGRIVIGRNAVDPARWKRYRGGTAGDLWVDADGGGEFRRLVTLNGNLASPMWIGNRVFFLSDHEGFGNIYSCLPDGGDLRRHTHHDDFYVRYPSTDGKKIAYHAGADLYVYDPAADSSARVDVSYRSQRVQRQRKFVETAKYLESWDPHPAGHSVAVTARGKSFAFGAFEGPVVEQATPDSALSPFPAGEGGRGVRSPFPAGEGGRGVRPVRRSLTAWLNDGERLVTIANLGLEDVLEIHRLSGEREPARLEALDLGRVYALKISPTHDHVALANHRNQLLFVDLADGKLTVVDRSEHQRIHGMDWSPDGRWIAYGFSATQLTSEIRLWDRTSGRIHVVTRPILGDFQPAFDPEGAYLYFLGRRDLNPVYDGLHFELGFPRGVRPFLVTLKADRKSPFVPSPTPLQEEAKPQAAQPAASPEEEATGEAPAGPPSAAPAVEIDLDGIADRVLAFPVPEGIYSQIAGIKGKALFVSWPVEGALGQESFNGDQRPAGSLEMFDLKELKQETLTGGISGFALSRDGKTLLYRSGQRLRLVKAGEKPDDKNGDRPGRRSGWIDLGRVRVSVDPGLEWRQMALDAWRLQREFFWTPDMSGLDWEGIWERYSPLLDRVGTRAEFSDLMWEMQGELGTSHAYEMGGDYRQEPSYPIGFLGADLAFDKDGACWRIARLLRGEPGEQNSFSPLMAPGIGVKEGSVLRAVNGQRLGPDTLPGELLVHHAKAEIVLTVSDADGSNVREVTVTTLRSEFPLRYRQWVESNRTRVHEATDGKCGYVHIPDMGARGFAEFHRLFLSEVERDAMIVDVRYNRGGHVSQLLLEKLARKRIGYDVSRWSTPEPYPNYSVAGPMVALTNQHAGSDGDIFSHCFKLMKLGPLIGKRTWGGVVGIWPRTLLADGTMTTQPEFSFWFTDVGWGVENYGTDPDVDVDIAPQDYRAGRDPQMDRAIEMVLKELEERPVVKPRFEDRPNLAPPKLKRP